MKKRNNQQVREKKRLRIHCFKTNTLILKWIRIKRKYRKEITENKSFVAERGKLYQKQP